MAEKGTMCLTMKDWLGLRNPDQSIAAPIEALNEVNEIKDDMLFREANGSTAHRTTIRTGLPDVAWRLLNYGVPQSKSTTMQVDDRMGILETWSKVDAKLVELEGEKRQFMFTEERPFLESMTQEAVRTLFYGSLENEPASFVGIAARYGSTDTASYAAAENVIDHGGAAGDTDLTSVYLMTWGDNTAHMIYPRGTPMGLTRTLVSGGEKVPLQDENGNEYLGYKTNYSWNLGFSLRDWRSCGRICNIKVSDKDDMVVNGATSQRLVNEMVDLTYRIPETVKRSGKTIWYARREILTMLHIMAKDKNNVDLTIATFDGKPVTLIQGIPIHQCDAIENGEEHVSA